MKNVLPNTYKGIVLFTPGGDLVYGIDPTKQTQWHNDLCQSLQKIWGLADSPHFLVPGYTATVERWFNPKTQQLETIAEVYPPVERYIPLLEMLFNLDRTTKWHIAPWQEEHCNRAIIETYKTHFPQLWENRDTIVRQDPSHAIAALANVSTSDSIDADDAASSKNLDNSSYILRLFIRGDRPGAEQTLSNIHQLLERGLNSPYTLQVIDINKNPQQATFNQIAVVPTLIRVSPKPTRKIVGQLDDIQKILNILTGF